MSFRSVPYLSCDSDYPPTNCHATLSGDPGDYADELRKYARSIGWKYERGGKDICPVCVAVQTGQRNA